MQRFGMMTRLIAVALGVVIAIGALASASAQDAPQHRLYGTGATAEDTITARDAEGAELGSATVAADGSWYIDVDDEAVATVAFYVNGVHADAEVTNAGESQSAVVLTVVAMEDESMPVDDTTAEDVTAEDVTEEDVTEEDTMEEDTMEEDVMEEDTMEEDTMTEDVMEEDTMEEDVMEEDTMEEDVMEEDAMEEDVMEEDALDTEGDSMVDDPDQLATDYSTTGTGGLVDNSGVSAGLIGLLIALGVAAAAGLGLRRVRNRA